MNLSNDLIEKNYQKIKRIDINLEIIFKAITVLPKSVQRLIIDFYFKIHNLATMLF